MATTVDQSDFKKALGHFASGVVVVTARLPNGSDVGVTISSFSSLSLDPALVVFCLQRSSYTLPAFYAGSSFSVNILAEGQEAISNHFAHKSQRLWHGIEMLDDGHHHGRRLAGCLAWLDCQTHTLLDGGDHFIITGAVERALNTTKDHAPLLYYKGRYRQMIPAAEF